MTASCRVVAAGSGDGTFSLRFELTNHGTQPLELPSYEPFLAFSVHAEADGVPVPVHEPELDIAVQRTTIRVPVGETITVETPIRLRIAAGAAPGSDGFEWTVPHAPQGLTLRATLNLPPDFAGTYPVALS